MTDAPRRILVCIKRVVDYNVRVRVDNERTGVVTDGVKMSVNPFDEIALEEALRIRERGDADEVVVCAVGSSDWQQQLRTGLAMGADRAVLVETGTSLEPLAVAQTLHAVVQREAPMLVLLGKQAIDGDNNQTGQMLAALWGRPQATFASSIVLSGESARVEREVDAGLEVLDVDLPAVVTTDLRLNEPRYVKLPEILKAKRKPLDVVPLGELGVDAGRRFRVVRVEEPPRRGRGIQVDTAEQLVAALDEKGVL
ncbi:MAG: electron transfer flavoprotein subunit beta/FixA family protein [Gammaproteobacteria bacterium]|nr:electron transfer flavoprotein subunit beta/FixA family protein [Gammaproteobacteria bacterium]